MSNRAVFVTSFLIATVILFAAFSLTQLFYFHLFESLIYVLIALMVFYGENRLQLHAGDCRALLLAPDGVGNGIFPG